MYERSDPEGGGRGPGPADKITRGYSRIGLGFLRNSSTDHILERPSVKTLDES